MQAPPSDENPLATPDFAIPFDRIGAEHVEPAIERLLERARADLARIRSDPAPSYAGVLTALERATLPLEHAMGVVGHLEAVATTPPLRAAYNAIQPGVSAFFSAIPLDPELWDRLRRVHAEQREALDPVRRRHLDKSVDDFRRHGAQLDAAGKHALAELEIELATITTRFAENVLDASGEFELVVEDRARLAGLPEHAIETARAEAAARDRVGYRFTLKEPSYLAVMTHLDDASIRERMYRAHATRASAGAHDNRSILARILRLRRDKARLLGYRDFADLVLEDRMAGSGARARAFVAELRRLTEPHFRRETAALAEFRAQVEGAGAGPIRPWDVAYWSERQRKALYDLSEETLRPYFPLERVLEGMFATAEALYGIRVVPGAALSTWHPDVRTFEVRDEHGTIGAFYADLHPRERKRDGAWMHPLFTGEHTASGWQPHLGLIAANVTAALGDMPALLSHREVETLFHEFGHLLHHLLTRVEVRSLAGTNVAWDFVELPSQIMENWCWEREALDRFARHHLTGEPLPADLFARMLAARTHRAASATMRQLGFAAVDLALHVDWDPETGGDVVAYARDVLAPYAPTPLPDDYAMICSFGHLFSSPVAYGAGYYSYKWAEVLDADAFGRFRDEGIFSRAVGRAFREAVLERGDGSDPMALFREFMGREPELGPLLERSGIAATAEAGHPG